MNWLEQYGYSDCVFCDIVAHKPWEPATYVYEDEEVAVFHNILGWIPVMLIAVPRQRIDDGRGPSGRHYHQLDLWRHMGHLGSVAMALGRAHCTFEGRPRFRLVCNIGPQALQTQQHAHVHILGSAFQPTYPDLRCDGRLVFEDTNVRAFSGRLESRANPSGITAVMVLPREKLSQDEFFARMDSFGPTILQIATSQLGESFRLLAEVGPHAPLPGDSAHLFLLGGGWLGHYV
jgi:diadenosine tetraphosphate (Ap4A) HIT family hydrolase